MWSSCDCLTNLVGVVVAVIVILISFIKWKHQYWKRKNVPYEEPSLLWGNMENPFTRKTNMGIQATEAYEAMKKQGKKHFGTYFMAKPTYVPVDLDYVKNILTKDFQNFASRGMYYNEKADPLSGNLFMLEGSRWRHMRTKLSPTFTSGQMKMMFQTLINCEIGLSQKIKSECESKQGIDIKEVLACFNTDVIGSCAFGLDLKSLEQDNSPFRAYGKKVFAAPSTTMLLKRIICVIAPTIGTFLGISLTPQDVTDFFMDAVKNTIKYRQEQKTNRKDFLQLLIDMNQQEDDTINGLTVEEITAQCFIFFLAGFETSSTTMTFALYELSRHPEIQDKLRDEINRVLKKHDEKVTYEALKDMKYMDMIIDETLRKYPPLPILVRIVTEDYKIDNEDVVLDKETRVFIPVYRIHHDPDIYPEPEKFIPERFSEENKQSRHPYAHLPFGEGPRVCIGLRFGMMQSKVGLTSLLRNYKFSVNKKTKEPLTISPKSFVLAGLGDVWLDAEKI